MMALALALAKCSCKEAILSILHCLVTLQCTSARTSIHFGHAKFRAQVGSRQVWQPSVSPQKFFMDWSVVWFGLQGCIKILFCKLHKQLGILVN